MKTGKAAAWLMMGAVILAMALGVKANWLIFAVSAAVLLTYLMLAEFEDSCQDSRSIALAGVLVAFAVVSRQLLHGIEFSPVFFIAIITGNVFGFTTGFAVGALTMFVSNFFIGQGPWTPFQMLGLGLTGAFAAFAPKKGRLQMPVLIAYSVATAFLYGALLDTFFWMAYIPDHTDVTLLAIISAGLFAAVSRALGNVFFMAIMGPVLLRILMRFKKRLVCRYVGGQPP